MNHNSWAFHVNYPIMQLPLGAHSSKLIGFSIKIQSIFILYNDVHMDTKTTIITLHTDTHTYVHTQLGGNQLLCSLVT